MALVILTTLLASTTTFVLYVILSRIRYFKLRAQIGLKGAETHWFLGENKKLAMKNCREFHEKFGDKFGVYFGKQLSILISDEEDIREIFIKHFSNFSDRLVPPVFREMRLYTSLLHVPYANGWKETRSAIGPIFASGKIKAMHETINSKIDTFLEILAEKSELGTKWDIYEDFQALTLDVIGKCAFAIDSDCQRNRDEMFYVQARKFIMNMDIKHSNVISASSTNVDGEGSESVDLLKLLLDREDQKKHAMNKKEVIENCFAFLLAGYETTSTAMKYCTHLLATHPDVQKRLFDEIVSSGADYGYESIHEMKYLDAVYKETLRLFPPVVHFVNRTCLEDIFIRGQMIPKGASVSVLPYTVHRNEDNWPNADRFMPERFLDWNEKNSLKWIPFGVGPRFCVGMRFAEMEFKTTIAKLVAKFEMSMDAAEPKLVPEVNAIIMRPKDPVRVTLQRRDI